jgi:hypothetical protein
MEETGLDEKETKLRDAVDRLKREMKGISEEDWIRAIKESRNDRRKQIPH